jgi:hypothetical protein
MTVRARAMVGGDAERAGAVAWVDGFVGRRRADDGENAETRRADRDETAGMATVRVTTGSPATNATGGDMA